MICVMDNINTDGCMNEYAYGKYLEYCRVCGNKVRSRKELRRAAGETFDRWMSCTDLARLFGNRCAPMRVMYVCYVMYCLCTGVHDAYEICTDREFSRMLRERGLERKRMGDGFWFVIQK